MAHKNTVMCITPYAIVVLMICCCVADGHTLTRENGVFLLDGIPITCFGLRAANALESDEVTARLLATLDAMRQHGIQSVNVSLQGANTGTGQAFNPDGTLRPGYMERMRHVVEALRVRGMVGVVTYFYEKRDQVLTSADAVRNATRNATVWLRPYRHVWLYVSNEPTHGGHKDTPLLGTPEGRRELYTLIKAIDPQRLVYMDNEAHDGFLAGTEHTACKGNVVTEYDRRDFYTYEKRNPPGVVGSSDRSAALTHLQATVACGGYWFDHAAWYQQVGTCEAFGCTPTPTHPAFPRFDKGGNGTAESPGRAFVWDAMRNLSHQPQLVPPHNLQIIHLSSGGS